MRTDFGRNIKPGFQFLFVFLNAGFFQIYLSIFAIYDYNLHYILILKHRRFNLEPSSFNRTRTHGEPLYGNEGNDYNSVNPVNIKFWSFVCRLDVTEIGFFFVVLFFCHFVLIFLLFILGCFINQTELFWFSNSFNNGTS